MPRILKLDDACGEDAVLDLDTQYLWGRRVAIVVGLEET
jgi:hypothetical protein